MGFLADMARGIASIGSSGIEDKVDIPIGTPVYPMLDLKDGRTVYPSDAQRAFYSNAFRACLLAKARPMSSLPVDVFARDGGVRRRATSRVAKALSSLMRTKWNPAMTASEGIRWAIMTKDTLGNAFVRVEWSHGVPVALWPMRMECQPVIERARDGSRAVVFRYPGDKFTREGTYIEQEIVWLKSPILDSDGVKGVSLADLAASELGLSIDLEDFYQKLISNGNHFPIWLETDQSLKDPDIKNLQQQLADHKGIVSAGETRVFDKGLHVNQTKLTMADMSLVEQERWILQQTCRTLSVPPQEVFDLSHATYSNVEQGARSFAQKTLMPECFMLEKSFSSILWAAGRTDEYVQINLDGLMRGDFEGRMRGYQIGIYSSVYAANEVRAKEDEEPYKGGDVYFRPAAYIPVDPKTGREPEGARSGTSNPPETGGSGEGVPYDPVNPNGRPPENALRPVLKDMEGRIRQRFEDKGDTPAARDFAARVLSPYADACLMARVPFDIDSEIDRLAKEATNA